MTFQTKVVCCLKVSLEESRACYYFSATIYYMYQTASLEPCLEVTVPVQLNGKHYLLLQMLSLCFPSLVIRQTF